MGWTNWKGPKGRCCVICGSRKKKGGVIFANFPSNENRCRTWVKIVGDEDLVHVPIEKLCIRRHICGEHFTKKDFTKKGTRLKRTAIPSVGLRASPLSEDQLREFPLHVASYKAPQKTENSASCEQLQSTLAINDTAGDVTATAPREFSWQRPPEDVPCADDVKIQTGVTLSAPDSAGGDSQDDRRPTESFNEKLHVDFKCNECGSEIVGYRYTCVQCLAVDLCGACEAGGAHPAHYVLRLPRPEPACLAVDLCGACEAGGAHPAHYVLRLPRPEPAVSARPPLPAPPRPAPPRPAPLPLARRRYRYTCVQCLAVDLCGACEAGGAHPAHYVLRLPRPEPAGAVKGVLETLRGLLDHEPLFQLDLDKIKKEEYDDPLLQPLAPAPPEDRDDFGPKGQEEKFFLEMLPIDSMKTDPDITSANTPRFQHQTNVESSNKAAPTVKKSTRVKKLLLSVIRVRKPTEAKSILDSDVVKLSSSKGPVEIGVGPAGMRTGVGIREAGVTVPVDRVRVLGTVPEAGSPVTPPKTGVSSLRTDVRGLGTSATVRGAGLTVPEADARVSGAGVAVPGAGAAVPGAGAAELGDDVKVLGAEVTVLGAPTIIPGAAVKMPRAGVRTDVRGTEAGVYTVRGNGRTVPGTEVRVSEAGVIVSGTGVTVPRAGVSLLRTDVLGLGSATVRRTGLTVPEADVRVSEAGVAVPGAGVSVPRDGAAVAGASVKMLRAGVRESEAGVTASIAKLTMPKIRVSVSRARVGVSGAGVRESGAHVKSSGAGVKISGVGVTMSVAAVKVSGPAPKGAKVVNVKRLEAIEPKETKRRKINDTSESKK